jgi:hypothetical protein
MSGERLGPRRDDVKEQATDCHTDREWVWQLFTSFDCDGFLVHKRRDTGCGLAGTR